MSNTNTTITAGQVAPAVVNLGSGTSITLDASQGNDYRLSLSGNTNITSMSNAVDGQRITLQIAQPSGSTGYTVSWDKSVFNFGTAGTPTLSTGGNLVDVVGFVWNASLSLWLGVGAALGF
jgi:hypothetical protein